MPDVPGADDPSAVVVFVGVVTTGVGALKIVAIAPVKSSMDRSEES